MKKLFMLFFIFIIISCNKGEEIVSTEEVIYIANQLNNTPFSQEALRNVFCIGKNNKVYESSYIQLNRLYLDKYKKRYKELNLFLYDALNQKIKLSYSDEIKYNYYYRHFCLEPHIVNLYTRSGINGIINEYCSSVSDRNGYQIINPLKQNDKNTIAYYFFINHFYKYEDDYSGKVWFCSFGKVR